MWLATATLHQLERNFSITKTQIATEPQYWIAASLVVSAHGLRPRLLSNYQKNNLEVQF